MRVIGGLFILAVCVGQVEAPAYVAKRKKEQRIPVRVTAYWSHGPGTDRWTKRRQSATGVRLVEGRHAAADPDVIPYGTRVEVPGLGTRIVVDTGSAVVSRKAAKKHGNVPVLDVYFANKEKALRHMANLPPVVEIRILE